MLVLTSLPKLLQRALAPPELHTAVLFTSAGALVAFATAPGAPRPKDDVHVLVGLASEVWSETRVDDEGVVDSELGRIIVVPVAPLDKETMQARGKAESDPILLIALNATDAVEWGNLQRRGHNLAAFIQKPLMQLQDKLTSPAPPVGRASRR